MLALLVCSERLVAEPPPPDHAAKMAASQQLFKDKVRPFLVAQCLDCHGGAKTKSGFSLATRDAMLKGGDRGAAVVPGKGAVSPLVKFVARTDEPHMPPKQAASKEAVEFLTKWIDLGAAFDKPLVEGAETAVKKPLTVSDKDRDYWAYRPLTAPPLPAVKDAAWPANPIDRFVLAKLEAKGVAPSADADRRTLIRRVTFDLIGLPPTPDEVEAFVADKSPDAYEKVVDRLLASPRYGERWARHWLDPARFAESAGFEHDYLRPNAYHYRDFVIKAINADMPYDKFVRWQVAGDELAPGDPLALAATGFLGAGVFPTQITTSEAERVRYDAMDDMVSTTGHAFLALTVGCARCHDHKYDPIPTQDYYRLLSAFTTTVRADVVVDVGTPEEKKAAAEFEAKLKPLTVARVAYEEKELPAKLTAWVAAERAKGAKVPEKGVPPPAAAALKELWADKPIAGIAKANRDAAVKWFAPQDEGWKKLDAAVKEQEKARPRDTKLTIQATTEGQKPQRHHTAVGSIPDFYPETFVLHRGDTAQKRGPAAPGVLQVLARAPDDSRWKVAKPDGATTSFRRATLAQWLTDTDTGAGALAARVAVNRLWHHHFGRGIVATVNDFGFQGDPPTHPELLEWLADDLVRNGWGIKRVHKLMVTSRVYRLSAVASDSGKKLDPDNRLWYHRPRRRLEAEAIRDSLLAVGGRLDLTMYGPGTLDEGMRRRSVYFTVKRSQLIPTLQVFDWPDTLTSTGVRPTTVVAPQALLFLNNPHVRKCAEGLAGRLSEDARKDPAAAVDRAYRLAFSRPPSSDEGQVGAAFLTERARQVGSMDKALTDYALALLSLNEFIVVE
ncbi:MAG: PSD1 and planctomycete cytochrome C domain-containing protein [Gemmataceae bacterium]